MADHDARQEVQERCVAMEAEVVALMIMKLDEGVEEAWHAVGLHMQCCKLPNEIVYPIVDRRSGAYPPAQQHTLVDRTNPCPRCNAIGAHNDAIKECKDMPIPSSRLILRT